MTIEFNNNLREEGIIYFEELIWISIFFSAEAASMALLGAVTVRSPSADNEEVSASLSQDLGR